MVIEEQDIEQAADPAMMEVLATSVVTSLFQFFRLAEIHDPKNKIFETAIANVNRTLESFFRLPGTNRMDFSFRGEHIFVNRIRLRPRPRQFYVYRHILKFMRFRRVGSFSFIGVPPIDQSSYFLWLMTRTYITDDKKEPVHKMQVELKERGYKAFELKVIPKLHTGEAGDSTTGEDEGLNDVELAAAYVYEQLRKFAQICFENLENAEKFSPPALDRLMSDLANLSEEDTVGMLRLVSLKRYDQPLPYRAVNACFLLSSWAFSLRLPRGVITELAGLALLHPFSLNAEGLPQVYSDPLSRAQLFEKIEKVKNVWPTTELQVIALSEWGRNYSGNGLYEIQSTKCYIHFFARMLRIVADFEMMTTFEKHRKTFLPDEALAEMLKDQNSYDPTLLKLFVNWMGVYPVGSLVQLQTGELAQVFAGSSDPTKFQRPIVCILKNASGDILDRPEIYDLTTMNEKLGTYRKTIRKSVSLDESGIPAEKFRMTPVGI